jgi:diaminopimelate epimerase
MKFWKMHGLGNDYIIIDNRKQAFNIHQREIENLCVRRFSIGADGIILVENSEKADVGMRILNADGGEAEMCGNGIRCLARYCYENTIVSSNQITIDTLAGIKQCTLILDEHQEVNSIEVDMGIPIFNDNNAPKTSNDNFINQSLEVNGEQLKATYVSMGNPHCVIFIPDVYDVPVETLGQQIENLELFPNKTNVEFVQVISRNLIKVRVWERGVGETLACGTGACASVVACKLLGKTDERVNVRLLGGDLEIAYGETILMQGPAEKIFEGRIFEV